MTEAQTHLIVGLGNPGRHYLNNRHNAGFMLVDRLLAEYGIGLDKSQSSALIAVHQHDEGTLVLAKPQTYVNESGRSVASMVRTFGIELDRLLIAFDDLDLPLGTLRLRSFGGSSGHRGMRSVINHLGGQGFPRMRIGIGRPPSKLDPARFVLGDFEAVESTELEAALARGADCVRQFIAADIQIAMNECNSIDGSIDTD